MFGCVPNRRTGPRQSRINSSSHGPTSALAQPRYGRPLLVLRPDNPRVGRTPLLTKAPGIYVAAGWLGLYRLDDTEVFGEPVIVDTGAGVLALPQHFAPKLGVMPDPRYRFGGQLPDGSIVEMHGALVLASVFGQPRELVPAYFHEALDRPLLGLQILMQRFELTFDGATKEMRWTPLARARARPIPLVDAP